MKARNLRFFKQLTKNNDAFLRMYFQNGNEIEHATFILLNLFSFSLNKI